MSSPIELLHRDPTLVLVCSGHLLVAVWWNAPTAAQMDVIADASKKLEAELAGPAAYAQFVITGTPKFTSEVRQKAEALTRDHYGLGIAHVIEVGGLVGAATRAFLSALLLVAQNDKPIRVFPRGQDGASWIADKLGGEAQGWTPERVLEVRERAVNAKG